MSDKLVDLRENLQRELDASKQRQKKQTEKFGAACTKAVQNYAQQMDNADANFLIQEQDKMAEINSMYQKTQTQLEHELAEKMLLKALFLRKISVKTVLKRYKELLTEEYFTDLQNRNLIPKDLQYSDL